MVQVMTGAPLWVWPLLVVLVMVGARARRNRWVPVGMVYALPLLGVLGLRTVLSLPAGGWIWGLFALAYVAGAYGGYVLQRTWILGNDGGRVQLAGEALTLTAVMVNFWASFAGGVLRAVAPGAYGSPVFTAVFVALLAASGGSFAGRALRVWRARI